MLLSDLVTAIIISVLLIILVYLLLLLPDQRREFTSSIEKESGMIYYHQLEEQPCDPPHEGDRLLLVDLDVVVECMGGSWK